MCLFLCLWWPENAIETQKSLLFNGEWVIAIILPSAHTFTSVTGSFHVRDYFLFNTLPDPSSSKQSEKKLHCIGLKNQILVILLTSSIMSIFIYKITVTCALVSQNTVLLFSLIVLYCLLALSHMAHRHKTWIQRLCFNTKCCIQYEY
jgi:hypothetical protein